MAATTGIWRPVFVMDPIPSSVGQDVTRQIPGRASRTQQNGKGVRDSHITGEEHDFEDDGSHSSENGPTPPSNDPVPKREPSLVPYHANNGNARSAAGMQAPRKAVQMDWDSDDEIIWQMKSKGYKDEPIRDRLIDEGRTVYDAKTIATRFSRMKRMVAVHEEKTLDEGFSDYHEDEDEMLHAAVAETEKDYLQDLARIDRRRWQNVSEMVNRSMEKAKYTKNSARERYDSLKAGTAICPVEKDPNAAARTALKLHQRLERQSANEAKRMAEKAARDTEAHNRMENRKRRAAEYERSRADQVRKHNENEQRKAASRTRHAERVRIKQETEQSRADRAATVAVEREQKKRAREEEWAAKKWQREQEKVARQEANQLAELDRIQSGADAKRQAIEDTREDNQRRELIRRFFRDAGVKTAAPRARVGAPTAEEESREGLHAPTPEPGLGPAPTTRSTTTAGRRKATTAPRRRRRTAKPRKSSANQFPLSAETIDPGDEEEL